MKRTRKTFQTVLGDGGILVPPGGWICFHEDTPFQPTLQQLVIWMREVRGAVLSDVFGIEDDLVHLQLAQEFGTTDHGTAPKKFFLRAAELRDNHKLERKIEYAKQVIRQHLEKTAADCAAQDLATCREIRNLMAHSPSWFEAVNDDERQRTFGLRLLIGDKRHIWELEPTDVAAWGTLFIRVRRVLIQVRHELTGLPAPDFVDDKSFVTKGPGWPHS